MLYAKNTTYSTNVVTPNFLFSFHLNAAIDMTIASNIPSNTNTEINSPPPPTLIGSFQLMQFQINQGNGRPHVTSKILLPIELETAISPSPLRVTAMLVSKSGTEVPAASIVYPIITLGIPNAHPRDEAHQTMK